MKRIVRDGKNEAHEEEEEVVPIFHHPPNGAGYNVHTTQIISHLTRKKRKRETHVSESICIEHNIHNVTHAVGLFI